jgi:hypothetical protein
MKRDTCRLNSRTYLAKFIRTSLLGVSACYYQMPLVGESGMIRTQMGKHNKSAMVAVHGTPCAMPRKQ